MSTISRGHRISWPIAAGLLFGLAAQGLGSHARASGSDCFVRVEATLQEVRLVDGAGDPADPSIWRNNALLSVEDGPSVEFVIHDEADPLADELVFRLSPRSTP